MIEEIKKEINQLDSSKCCNEVIEHCCINYKDVMEILDKYNNQPDYKSAYEEIIKEFFKDDKEYCVADRTRWKIQEVKDKYNLGGE